VDGARASALLKCLAVKPSNDLLHRLGGHLRAMREDRGLTQEEVAARAGFTAKYLSECERGLRDLPFTSLRAIVEDGLGGGLDEVLAAGAGARDPVRSLPRPMLALCRELVELPPVHRRAVLGILRGALALARRLG
jgi:transcriptional regulator with XRE-family HTH domain